MSEIDFKRLGYRLIDTNTLEFYCDGSRYPDIAPDEEVYVTGSFNDWCRTADSAWHLTKKVEKKQAYYVLQKPLSVVSVPGNSGYPEFKFFALSSKSVLLLQDPDKVEGYTFIQNKLIISAGEKTGNIQKISAEASVIKTLADFDLNCPACRAEISNFRPVPGTKCLFRGYHPFKRSRPEIDTEAERLSLVQKALKLYGIKTVITLCGNEAPDKYNDETMPKQILSIEEKQNRLCMNINYNLVYYHSDVVEVACVLQKIARFMLSHPGPYYVHCRLGIDRTGVISAVFGALCGASWAEIAADYEKISGMGTGEYRDRRLLQYALKKMIGYDPADAKDLGYIVQTYFIAENILSIGEIEKLIKKLNTAPRKKETDFFDFSLNHICARRNAKI